MAYSAPSSRSTGFAVTAPVWNQDVVDNILFLANQPACKVHKASAQSITSGSGALLLFDTEDWDTASMHSTVTNTGRITCTMAGLYVVHGYLSMATATDYSSIIFELTAATVIVAGQSVGSINPSGTGIAMSISALVKLAVNEYVTASVFQVNGAGAARNATATMSAVRVGF